MIWNEKYRPKEFNEVIGLPSEIPRLIENLPHLLFIGKPGTGKTTTAKIIIDKLGSESLTLNASKERGIDIIRDKVTSFAMTKSINGNFKIVFLDEADSLTPDAQNSLRNTMETYATNCRFILTGNNESKVIDPLKSRCTPFRFERDDEMTYNFLLQILTKENKIGFFDLGIVKEIVKKNHGDIRKCINKIQQLSGLNRPVLITDLNSNDSELVDKIHKILVRGDFIQARQITLDESPDYAGFLEEYHQYILDLHIVKNELSFDNFKYLCDALAYAISNIGKTISDEIFVEQFFYKAIGVLKK